MKEQLPKNGGAVCLGVVDHISPAAGAPSLAPERVVARHAAVVLGADWPQRRARRALGGEAAAVERRRVGDDERACDAGQRQHRRRARQPDVLERRRGELASVIH